MTTATYAELTPPRVLRDRVACFWRSTTGDEATEHRIVPDASTDVLVVDGGAPFVVGPMSVASIVTLPPRTTITAVRFRPGAADAVLGVDASELLDERAPLDALWGAAAEPLGAALASADFDAAAGVLASRRSRPLDPLVLSGVRWLAAHPYAPVRALEAETGLGTRQLLRRFRASVGFGPKVVARILRFQRFLVAPPTRTLASAAIHAGYLDHAHLTREVRELTGVTPRELPRERHATPVMSDFFKSLEPSRATLAG